MSFRRDRDAELDWRRWVRAHEAELIAIGIPREVWADRPTWWRFVDHGFHAVRDIRDVRFSADDLPGPQQRRLYEFLASMLPEPRSSSFLWTDLNRRFGATTRAGEELP